MPPIVLLYRLSPLPQEHVQIRFHSRLQDMMEQAGKRAREGPLGLGHIAWEHLALLDSGGLNFLCEVVCQLIAVDVDDFRRHEDICFALDVAKVTLSCPLKVPYLGDKMNSWFGIDCLSSMQLCLSATGSKFWPPGQAAMLRDQSE